MHSRRSRRHTEHGGDLDERYRGAGEFSRGRKLSDTIRADSAEERPGLELLIPRNGVRRVTRNRSPTPLPSQARASHPASEQDPPHEETPPARRPTEPAGGAGVSPTTRCSPTDRSSRRGCWPNDSPVQPNPPPTGCRRLPTHTPINELVRLGKLLWRIEHDYRELKVALGLGHSTRSPIALWLSSKRQRSSRQHTPLFHRMALTDVRPVLVCRERVRPAAPMPMPMPMA